MCELLLSLLLIVGLSYIFKTALVGSAVIYLTKHEPIEILCMCEQVPSRTGDVRSCCVMDIKFSLVAVSIVGDAVICLTKR